MIKNVQLGARIILGLIYGVFGAMGLAMVFGLMAMPQPTMPEKAMAFMSGINATGYFLPVLKLTETCCGLLLIFNWAAPLALVILAPITLHIVLFHGILTPGVGNLVLPVMMLLLHVVAITMYWNLYQPLWGRK